MTIRAALALGANLGDRCAALQHAIGILENDSTVTVIAVSDLYETDPIGGPQQPQYLNAVVVLESNEFGADEPSFARFLLRRAHDIEQQLQRTRGVRWGPRTMDVDVLAVGGWESADPQLIVPHPRIGERAFVLVPWEQVDAEFVVAGLDQTVAELLAQLPAADRATVERMPQSN